MKNEWDIAKASLKLFIVMELIMIILSIILKRMDIAIGFLWGYFINLIAFYLMVQSVNTILMVQYKTKALVGIFFVARMGLYALGFYVAYKITWINLYSAFIGYFVVKMTLHLEKHLFKGGV